MKEYIKNRVHELYWNDDINCARTAIICLGELFETTIDIKRCVLRLDCMVLAVIGRNAA